VASGRSGKFEEAYRRTFSRASGCSASTTNGLRKKRVLHKSSSTGPRQEPVRDQELVPTIMQPTPNLNCAGRRAMVDHHRHKASPPFRVFSLLGLKVSAPFCAFCWHVSTRQQGAGKLRTQNPRSPLIFGRLRIQNRFPARSPLPDFGSKAWPNRPSPKVDALNQSPLCKSGAHTRKGGYVGKEYGRRLPHWTEPL
jgi:hypothetical protein